MYLLPEARGKGNGKKLMERILKDAKQDGYQTIYLDTDVKLTSSIGLYKKYGFQQLNTPIGNTGHNTCGVYMSRSL